MLTHGHVLLELYVPRTRCHVTCQMQDVTYSALVKRSQGKPSVADVTFILRDWHVVLHSIVYILSYRLGRLFMWEWPLAEHHPDHAPSPRLLQWSAGQTGHSISFSSPSSLQHSHRWFKRCTGQFWAPNVSWDQITGSLWVLLSFGCQQQQAIRLVLGLQCSL